MINAEEIKPTFFYRKNKLEKKTERKEKGITQLKVIPFLLFFRI